MGVSTEVNFSNLNFGRDRQTVLHTDEELFREVIDSAGYDGAEITDMRSFFLRRMLGHSAATLTRGLHASFAGRTFPEVLGDTFTQPQAIKRNIGGLMITVALPEVSRSTKRLARFQKRIGKGNSRETSKLDAVLYPFSGDSRQPLYFNDASAPFRTRTFQLTAEVLHRWGLPIIEGAPNDELLGGMQKKMEEVGLDKVTMAGTHSRRRYVENGEIYGLPDGFVEAVALAGLFENMHIEVGRDDVLTEHDKALTKATTQELELLKTGKVESFAKTQQGEWAQMVRASIDRQEGDDRPFRMTVEWPGSVHFKDGSIAGTEEHREAANVLRALPSAA